MIDFADPQFKEKMMRADMCYWAEESGIKLMGGILFSLDGCGYLAGIVRDKSDEKVIMKGAQARITTLFMLDAIHCLINNLYPQGAIYYFPTEKAVETFSKTRFGPLVADNSVIRRHLQNTNSVSIKKVGKTFLRLFGASATKIIQGQKKDSTQVRSEPADIVYRDERDLFDDVMVRITKDRLQNSKIGKEVDLGTPTMPDFGISKGFNESNQQFRLIKCDACNSYTCIVEEFPNSIKYKRDTTHEPYYPYYGCIKCGKQIFVGNGQWVAKYPDRRVAGWQVSHFITPNIKLPKVMGRWEEVQRTGVGMQEFYNGVLGLPYIAAEDRLKQSDVFECCGNDMMRTDISIVQTAMGCDIKKHWHNIVIGEKVSKKRGKIIYMARVKGFDAIYDIAKKYNVKSAVIDRRPYEEEFEKFQTKASTGKYKFRVYGAEYHDRQKVFMKTDESEGTYSLLRTQMFDKSHNWIKSGNLEIPRRCAEVDEFAKQMCNCAKVLQENEQGDRLYRYIKLGEEDYRNAVNYLMLALDDLTYVQGMNAPGYQEVEAVDWNPLLV